MHSSTLAWKIPWTEEPGRLQSMGSLRVRHGWATSLSLFTFMHWRRKWQPTPMFLPGESQGRGSLVGCVYGIAQSQTRLKRLCSISFNISPSKEHLGLILFTIDWFDLLADQGTLKRLLQHHSSKASILRCSAFFILQLSYPYMTTGKTIALTRWTFVDKIMPLLFNMLSRLVITFLPRSKHLLISWLQSPSAVILSP